MSLAPGTRLGPYEITAQIGVGGMGEVYRATDTKLKRQVAIKVLPEAVASAPERLARFRREAEVLASLNHPNIAQIHGLEDSDGTHALVMELVEGPTLADRIAQGPIPVDEALPIAKQIAEALEAAHEQGIIHRDLKPANVKVRDDGTVKVLDFGLAKAMESPGGSSPDVTQSPTITSPAVTQIGVILGTPAYMSPEQARGSPVDKRADIWAFGGVLYEMLTGRRAFDAEDVSLTLAEVMKSEPDWSALPQLPPAVSMCLRQSLKKDPRQRLRDMGDARLALAGALELTEGQPAASVPRLPAWQRPTGVMLVGLAAVVAGGLVAWGFLRDEPTPVSGPSRLSIVPEEKAGVDLAGNLVDLTISPDGSFVVYQTGSSGSGTELVLRRFDQFPSTPIRGTQGGACCPFVSPDSRSVGFSDRTDRVLFTVSRLGGPARRIVESPSIILGATWTDDERIVFGTADGLFAVPVAGADGAPQRLTTPDVGRGEVSHVLPHNIPGRAAIAFTIRTGGTAAVEVAVLDLGSRAVTRLGLVGSSPQYSTTGHLLYTTIDGTVMAVPFDAALLRATGDALPVLEGVVVKEGGAADLSLSRNGTLVYMPGRAVRGWGLVLQPLEEDSGARLPIESPGFPRWSPDGDSIAYSSAGTVAAGSGDDIYVYSVISRSEPRQLTFVGNNQRPVWAPDGTRLLFASERDGTDGFDLFVKRLDDDSPPERVSSLPGDELPLDWVSDDMLVFRQDGRAWTIDPASPSRGPRPYPEVGTTVSDLRVSPDGSLAAYVSDESGQPEVYVRSFPAARQPEIVSQGGGTAPRWSPDGRTIYYLSASESNESTSIISARIDPGPPAVVTSRGPVSTGVFSHFDPDPDGGRLLILVRGGTVDGTRDADSTLTPINVVLNFFEELRRLPSTP